MHGETRDVASQYFPYCAARCYFCVSMFWYSLFVSGKPPSHDPHDVTWLRWRPRRAGARSASAHPDFSKTIDRRCRRSEPMSPRGGSRRGRHRCREAAMRCPSDRCQVGRSRETRAAAFEHGTPDLCERRFAHRQTWLVGKRCDHRCVGGEGIPAGIVEYADEVRERVVATMSRVRIPLGAEDGLCVAYPRQWLGQGLNCVVQGCERRCISPSVVAASRLTRRVLRRRRVI